MSVGRVGNLNIRMPGGKQSEWVDAGERKRKNGPGEASRGGLYMPLRHLRATSDTYLRVGEVKVLKMAEQVESQCH